MIDHASAARLEVTVDPRSSFHDDSGPQSDRRPVKRARSGEEVASHARARQKDRP